MVYTTIAEFTTYVGTTVMNNLMNEHTGADIAARQTQILNGAEDMINGYASVKWTIPLPVSYLVKHWTLVLAQYYLYIQMEGNDVPERVKAGYEQVIKQLVDLAGGVIKPPPDASTGATATVAAGGSSVSMTSDTAIFTETDMEYF